MDEITQHNSSNSSQETEEERAEEFQRLIPPGPYWAQCVKYKEFKQYGTEKLVLIWDFAPAKGPRIQIPQYLNLEHKVFKEYSFYYVTWVIANNYQRPRRKTRAYMSPKIFLNIIGRVLVSTVTPRFQNGELKPEVFHYSKVAQLLEISPPNNTRKR